MKPAALRKADLESALGRHFHFQEKPPVETISTGAADVDAAAGGLPRGCVTEICGPASSGRTGLLISVLAEATVRQEVCALVDATDAFDPTAAIDLDRLLWIRCGGNVEHALKALDLLLHGGGFGVVALDIADVPHEVARRIPLASWFRLRRAIENTPTALIVVEREAYAKSCSSLVLEMSRDRGKKLSVTSRFSKTNN